MRSNRGKLAEGARSGVAVPVIALVVLAATFAFGAWAGPARAQEQQAGEVYASADLLPEGAMPGQVPPGAPSGIATFLRLADGRTQVVVTASGLQPNSRHVNHIHDGSCTGTILIPLQTLEADGSGMARAVTEIDQQVEFGRWYVNVHAGDTLPSPGIMCGQVNPAMAGTPPVMQPEPEPPGMPRTGHNSSGWLGTLALPGALLALAVVAAGVHARRRAARKTYDRVI
jgi:hypothetical protein